MSTRAPGGVIRRILAVLLLASGLKLLGFGNVVVLGSAAAALVLGSLVWPSSDPGPRPEVTCPGDRHCTSRGRGVGAGARRAAGAEPTKEAAG